MTPIVFDSEVMEKAGLAVWGSAKDLCEYYDQIVDYVEMIGDYDGGQKAVWEMEIAFLEEMAHEYLFSI